jgi:MoaD family protein
MDTDMDTKESVRPMKIKVKLLKPYSDAVGKGELDLDFNGNSIKELIDVLVGMYPKLKDEFLAPSGELTDYMCIFLNDKPVTSTNQKEPLLKNGDTLVFFIPVSGG